MMIGSKLYRMKECNDSLAWAREHIQDAPDGSVFLADTLTFAHGRQGREWIVCDGQLLVTILLKPVFFSTCNSDDLPVRLNQLNMAISVGIARSLEPYGVGIKWPNDFVVHDKKVGGVISLVVWRNNRPTAIIVGFGINVNTQFNTNDSLYAIATSLAMVVGHDVDRRSLYQDLLKNIDHEYTQWNNGQFELLYRAWRSRQVYLGRLLHIHKKDGASITGIAKQVLPNGDLMLHVEGDLPRVIMVPFSTVQDVVVPT